MKPLSPVLFLLVSASMVSAEDSRQLDAHEHGVGQLDIAFEGNQIAMELHAPGADIVGFEYAAESAEDRASVDAAVASLARPLDLFGLPQAAGCSVVQAGASLNTDEAHEDHEGEDHAEHKEDDHDHAEHEEDHADEAGHTEFHATYLLTCAKPEEATVMTFPYFETFPNALELEVQVISDSGATAFEVERASPTLDLRDMF